MPTDTNEGRDEIDLVARLLSLEAENAAHASRYEAVRLQLESVLISNGIHNAIAQASGELAAIFEPLKALAPSHEFGEEQAAITALRVNMARPNFDAPPVAFDAVFSTPGKFKGGKAK